MVRGQGISTVVEHLTADLKIKSLNPGAPYHKGKHEEKIKQEMNGKEANGRSTVRYLNYLS